MPEGAKEVAAWIEKQKLKGVGTPMKQSIPAWLLNSEAELNEEIKQKGLTSPFMSVKIKQKPASMAEVTPPGQFHRILLLGDSGTGKTHFIGTMPKPFIADFDRGLSTLRGKDVLGTQYDQATGWLLLKQEVQDWRKGPEYDCLTFALDSLTMASEAAMSYVLTKNNRTNPTIADWGEAIREVKELLGYLTTLPCHVVVTAHNQLVRDEMLGDIQYLPLIFGKDLPHRLGIWFDEVYATTVVTTLQGGTPNIQYRLQVKPDARNKILKSRMNTDGLLFSTYEEPSFVALTKKTSKE